MDLFSFLEIIFRDTHPTWIAVWLLAAYAIYQLGRGLQGK